MGELADQRVHLFERHGKRGLAFQVLAHEPIRGLLDLDRHLAGGFDGFLALVLYEIEDAEDPAYAGVGLAVVDRLAHDSDRLTGIARTREQPNRALGRLPGPIFLFDPMLPLLLPYMLAE